MAGPRDNYDPYDDRTEQEKELQEEEKNLEDEWYKEDDE
jgi:hypothetical protein